MVSFYSFAQAIENIFGSHYVILIYFISMIGGNLFSLYLHKIHPDYSALGASGAVSGIIFSSIFLLPDGSIYIFLLPIAIPAYLYGILFILISIYGIRSNNDNIGHEAHLGGSISGILIILLLSPYSIKKNIFLFLIIMTIFVGFIIYLKYNPIYMPKINFNIYLKSKIKKLKKRKQVNNIKKDREKLTSDLAKLFENAKNNSVKNNN